jgi:hypothetical protein
MAHFFWVLFSLGRRRGVIRQSFRLIPFPFRFAGSCLLWFLCALVCFGSAWVSLWFLALDGGGAMAVPLRTPPQLTPPSLSAAEDIIVTPIMPEHSPLFAATTDDDVALGFPNGLFDFAAFDVLAGPGAAPAPNDGLIDLADLADLDAAEGYGVCLEEPFRTASIHSQLSATSAGSGSADLDYSIVTLSPSALSAEEAHAFDALRVPSIPNGPEGLAAFAMSLPLDLPNEEEDAMAQEEEEEEEADSLPPVYYDSDRASQSSSSLREGSGSSPSGEQDADEDEDEDLGDVRLPRAEKQELARRPFAKRSKPDFYHDMTAEERRLIEREGFAFPNRALTKSEEKELKKLRRKVKNKISAQDSRKRRKEYITILEGKVQTVASANLGLKSRVTSLEKANHTLLEKLQELQHMLVRYTGKGRPSAGAALMILGLCFSLFVSPDALSSTGGGGGLHRSADSALPGDASAGWAAFQSRTLKALPEGDPAAAATPAWSLYDTAASHRRQRREDAGATPGDFAFSPGEEQQLQALIALLQSPHDAAEGMERRENATAPGSKAHDADEAALEASWTASAALPSAALVSATA